MLWLLLTLGGLLLMMGHHSRSESLFYYFRIEDQVPETIFYAWLTAMSASTSYEQS
jgi:hypothetical protein